MPVETVGFERFGGMRLDIESMELGVAAAEDAKDVRLREQGRVAPREGDVLRSTMLGIASLTVGAVGYTTPSRTVVVGTGSFGRARAHDGSGVQTHVQSFVAGNAGLSGITRFGQSSSSDELYLVAGQTSTMYRYRDSDGFVAIGLPAAITDKTQIGHIAYLPESNRLVVADSRVQTNNRVWFFDPDSTTAMIATSFVGLQPGVDSILALLMWERQLVVIKPQQIFWFGAPSTDQTGEAVFDYRVLELGGMGSVDLKACVGRRGIYLASPRGIYLTRGGAPELISGPVQPLFDGFIAGGRTGSLIGASSFKSMVAHRERIHIGTTGGYTLVYDERSDDWTYDSYVLGPAVSSPLGLWFVNLPGSSQELRELDGDLAVPSTARYRSGFYEARQGEMSALRRTVLGGVGTVTLKQAQDGGALDAGAAVALGSTTAPARGYRLKATRGRKHQFELTGSGVWSVHRLEHHVGRARRPATETV